MGKRKILYGTLMVFLIFVGLLAVLMFINRFSHNEPENPGTKEVGQLTVNTGSSKTQKELEQLPVNNKRVKTVEDGNFIAQKHLLTSDNKLPEIDISELAEQNPVLKEILKRGKSQPLPSKYAYVDSVDELLSIIEEWHSLKKYEIGRFSETYDLLLAAKRLASIRDENWPIANWCLGQLLQDVGSIKESASIFSSLIEEMNIEVDASLKLEAMFRLALIEFSKPISYWWGGSEPQIRNMSITQPERSSFDVAKELFAQLMQSTSQGDELHMLAQEFYEASEKYRLYVSEQKQKNSYLKYDNVLDSISEFKTSLILAKELYGSNVNTSERVHILKHVKHFVESTDFREYLQNLPTEDKRFWATNVTWMLHDGREHESTIDILEPLVDSEVWDNRDIYAISMYNLAYSYNRLGEDEKAKSIVDRLISEGFDFNQMEPAMKIFFVGMQEKEKSN